MKFQSNLKKIRKRIGLSQQKLADDLGVVQGCIGNWETGRREPKVSDIIKLSNVLGVSTNELTGISRFNNLTIFENETLSLEKMPLYASHVSAGFPSPADDYIEGRLDLNDLNILVLSDCLHGVGLRL